MNLKAKILQDYSKQKNQRYFRKYRKQIGEKTINTLHGPVRVLEFGFHSKEVEPLFIDLHGGGFVYESAEIDIPLNLYLSKKAQAKIISIDYPKAPQYPYPIAIESIIEVIQVYLDLCDVFRFDPKAIGIGGHSSGGNLATAIAMRSKHIKGLKFKFQALVYPPLDLATKPELKNNVKGAISPGMANMFNESYVGKDFDKLRSPEVSPIYALKQDLEKMPDTLIIAAGKDSLHDENVQYKDMLESAGVDVEFHDFENAPHGFTYQKSDDGTKALDVIAQFIEKYRKKSED